MKRLLVVGLIASVLVVTRAGEASACSCVALQPATALEEFDGAFVGTIVDRPLLQMPFTEDAPFTFEVETWVKGDLGTELVVYAPNQGSACGFEAPVGERVGVLINVEDGKARGNLCTTVDADLLLAGDQPLDVDGTGPPVFLVAGYDGPGRLMLLDASGGLLAAIGGSGESLNGLALCPGAEFLVEMMTDQLIVRSVADLAEIRRVDLDGLPYEVGVPKIWCRDETGDTLWVSADEWTEDGGTVFRLLDASDLSRSIIEGAYGWLDVGGGFAVAGEGPTAKQIWRIDLSSGDRSLLHEIPMEPGDSEPSGWGWIDPAGERVMITQWRYRDDSGGNTTFFLYELAAGGLVWQSEILATADGLGWVDDTTFVAHSYPDMNSDVVDNLLINTDNFGITHLPQLPGWSTLRVGDHLTGVANARLEVMPFDGGDPALLRLLPSESHHLAAVLDQQAVVTPTTRPETTITPGTGPDDEPATAVASEEPVDVVGGGQVEMGHFPWWFPAVTGSAILIGLALFAVWRRRV